MEWFINSRQTNDRTNVNDTDLADQLIAKS